MGTKEATSNIESANYDFILRVIKGADKGKIFSLSIDRMIVGRSIVAEIEIHEIYAAQNHFEIYWDKLLNSHVVRDCGSMNGVYINDLKIGTKEIQLGDKIRVGNTTFIFERALKKK